MKNLRAALKGLLPDAFMLTGICALIYGAASIYRPAGWIVAGGFALGLGFLLARGPRGGI
jgi:hypothetical protein